jgi:hypothetical protein
VRTSLVLLGASLAVRGRGGVDQRLVEELADRLGAAVAVEGVGVLVAGDHELRARAPPGSPQVRS